ncbi:hypothetical protein [Dyella sp. 333MFSha]|uniref:hypothetical protein n=1 Tax=Dyella sp. 333MFSha TaxID=1798240 RepID=UPI000890B071|nr:hypothetical protein [Dyella sp. 333MFSha]SDF39686.1 hypothetical protein SAMN04515659_0853 [Dyella sp. 333MFSha]
MSRRTRTTWVVSIALGWAAVALVAHVLNDVFGAVVFLGGVVALILWRVVPRLRGLLQTSAGGFDRTRRRWRYARADLAEAFDWPDWLRLLWYLAALLCLVSVVLGMAAPEGLPGQVLVPTAWSFLMTVAAMDLLSLVRVGLRRSNGKAFGVVLASVGTAVVAAVALSFARKSLFGWMGEDPGAFPASLTLLTAALVPLGWLMLIAVVSAVLMLPMVVASLWQLGNTRRIDREGSFHAFLVSLRPVFICAVPLSLFTHVWGWRAERWPALQGAGMALVVALDYWERPVCGGPVGVANRLDDGHYSIVTGGNNLGYRFKTVTCATQGAVTMPAPGSSTEAPRVGQLSR